MQEPKENRDKRQCRSCLSVGNELLDIFQEGFHDTLSILSGLQVTLQDCFPNYICMDCVAVLKKFIEFRENCKKSYDFFFKLQHGYNKGFDKVSESTISNRTPITLESNDSQSEILQIDHENDSIEIKHEFVRLNLSNCINNYYTEESQPKNEWNDLAIVKNVDKNVCISDEPSSLEVQNDSISTISGSSEIESVSEHFKTPVKKKRQRIGAIAQDKAKTKRKPKGRVVKIIKKKISHMDNVDPLKIEKIRLSMDEQKAELVKKSQSEDYLNAPYKCENCFKYFLYEDNYNNHLRTRHDESIGPHLCTLCQSRFKAKGTLTSHAYKHSVIFRCLACSVSYKKFISAEEHYKIVHEKMPPTLVCHLCGKISNTFRESVEDLESPLSTHDNIATDSIVENEATADSSKLLLNSQSKKSSRVKRKRNPEGWIRNIRKNKREHGEEYIDINGKLHTAKKAKSKCTPNCHIQCMSKFSEEDRRDLCSQFYKLSDDEKIFFYNKYTSRKIPERRSNAGESRKRYTYMYCFELDSEIIQVCKLFFCSTLGISSRRVYYFHENLQNADTGIPRMPRKGRKFKRCTKKCDL